MSFISTIVNFHQDNIQSPFETGNWHGCQAQMATFSGQDGFEMFLKIIFTILNLFPQVY